MKARQIKVAILLAAIAALGLTVAACGSSTTAAPAATSTAAPSAPADTASPAATAPAGAPVLPVASNPIVNDSTKPGLKITSAAVENNVDPATKQDIADRLQIALTNSSTTPMSDIEVYYEMTDTTTGAKEGYYQKLTGFTLAPGETGTVFFDNETGPGHYPENTYSLYRTSKNEVVFAIEASQAGFAPAMGKATKGPGTGEVPGE